MVSLLLALLAILVTISSNGLELKLSRQLASTDGFAIYLNEQVAPNNPELLINRSLEEESLFADLAKEGDIPMIYLRQVFLMGTSGNSLTGLPIVVYGPSFEELSAEDHLGRPRVWLLCDYPSNFQPRERIRVGSKEVIASPRIMPPALTKVLKKDRALAIPFDYASPLLRDGFLVHLYAQPSNFEQLEGFQTSVTGYLDSEKRSARVFSSLNLLREIEGLGKTQRLIRWGITIGCCCILSIILGTIAWLEYRHEAYLLNLLRSFGTPKSLLILHAWLENCLPVAVGTLTALLTWPLLLPSLGSRFNLEIPLEESALLFPQADARLVLSAALAGVVLAMIPVIWGLRRPVGLSLQ